MISHKRRKCSHMICIIMGQQDMPDHLGFPMQPSDQRAAFWSYINNDQTAITEVNDRAIALSHIPKIYM